MNGVMPAERYRLLFAELNRVLTERARGIGSAVEWEAEERDVWEHLADAATCHVDESQGRAQR